MEKHQTIEFLNSIIGKDVLIIQLNKRRNIINYVNYKRITEELCDIIKENIESEFFELCRKERKNFITIDFYILYFRNLME